MVEKRLKLLASWLEDSDSGIDPFQDGTLECAVKYAKAEVKQEIGGLLQEIMDMDDEYVRKELISSQKPDQEYPF